MGYLMRLFFNGNICETGLSIFANKYIEIGAIFCPAGFIPVIIAVSPSLNSLLKFTKKTQLLGWCGR